MTITGNEPYEPYELPTGTTIENIKWLYQFVQRNSPPWILSKDKAPPSDWVFTLDPNDYESLSRNSDFSSIVVYQRLKILPRQHSVDSLLKRIQELEKKVKR